MGQKKGTTKKTYVVRSKGFVDERGMVYEWHTRHWIVQNHGPKKAEIWCIMEPDPETGKLPGLQWQPDDVTGSKELQYELDKMNGEQVLHNSKNGGKR